MRISDWSSDVCSSDLVVAQLPAQRLREVFLDRQLRLRGHRLAPEFAGDDFIVVAQRIGERQVELALGAASCLARVAAFGLDAVGDGVAAHRLAVRSEEHTSELQSLMRISYAVFCLKKKKQQ